jgi:pimeloyl-ACP methyl ester carboxylesterase
MNSMQVLDMPVSESHLTLSLTIDDAFPDGSRTAVLAHGAGSSADFVQRAFGAPLRSAGWRLVAYDLRGHGRSAPVTDPAQLQLADHVADLLAVAARTGATLLGGVSMGAHAAVSAALQPAAPRGLEGLLVALPAWTGAPDVVAAANAVQAAELRAVGVDAVLDRVCTDHPGWVADELATSWTHHDPAAFAAVLSALAASPGPTTAQLGRLQVPVGLVALDDDPMHPSAVADEWARLIPHAAVAHVAFSAPAPDRAVLGHAAVEAWRRARSLSGSR